MKELQNTFEFNNLINNNEIILIQFGSHTCPPCHAIRNRIDIYLKSHEIMAIYIPIEHFKELSANLQVLSVPTILVYIQGKLALKESGYFSLELLLHKIDRYLNLLKK